MFLRAVLLGCLATGLTLDVTDRQTQTVLLPPGRAIGVALTVGHLRVVGEARQDAVIEVVRTAPDAAALTRIPVRIDETASHVRVVAVQSDGGTDAALKTDVSLRVPHDAVLEGLRVMEGRITLRALRGRVDADLRRGPIEASALAGQIRLETGIGDVRARDLTLVADGVIRLRAFNGSVRLQLAERPRDARVMALVLDGDLKSAIPLTVREGWGPTYGEATLGRGEPVISIDVVTGNVEIETK